MFTDTEREYLVSHPLGRLASSGPDGAPQINPVAFQLSVDGESIEIGGPDLRSSQKFRNIEADPRVSFVVDDLATPEETVGAHGQRGRGVEIRGRAETVTVERPMMDGFSHDLIRIRGDRIISWNIEGPGTQARDVRDPRLSPS
jgi:pyridoxamine 5'-phosphate oxidase family protein